MIHELLLALSGHPSPFLNPEASKDPHLVENLSPPEIALLERLAQDLGGKHIKIRDGAAKIISSHPSNVCRAVATSVTDAHLFQFQNAIVQVERDILQQSPSLVGAYNQVPLAGVVNSFNGWKEKLDWLADLVHYMQAGTLLPSRGTRSNPCTGKQIIEWLRQSTRTGYPEIEDLALQLSKIAELSWLKQASLWILHGRLPSPQNDFFIVSEEETTVAGKSKAPSLNVSLIPSFTTPPTATSILFIGKTLNHIGDIVGNVRGLSLERSPSASSFIPKHLAYLSTLTFPLNSSEFANAISNIRTSISENALQKLLPMPKILEALHILRQYFLLEKGEFAVALIISAEEQLLAKQSVSADRPLSRGLSDLARLTIKESEVSTTLVRAWTSIATSQDDEEDEIDDDFELARGWLKLSIGSLEVISQGQDLKEDVSGLPKLATFDDLLLPTPTYLTMAIQHPLDLCITSASVNTYSHIHAYLLSIRRASHQLNKLYLFSNLRRTRTSHATPASSSIAKPMRAVWVMVSSAIFFLAELGDFLQGTVIQQSWDRFHAWLEPTVTQSGSRPSTGYSKTAENDGLAQSTFRDPDAFMAAHDEYIHALTHSLLLDFEPFTKELRAFMSTIDHLSALVQRLDVSLEIDGREDKGLLNDLQPLQRTVAQGLRTLVATLHAVDEDRARDVANLTGTFGVDEDGFVPWKIRGVDQLLLKLGHIEDAR